MHKKKKKKKKKKKNPAKVIEREPISTHEQKVSRKRAITQPKVCG